jgi:ribonuclease HI
MTTEIFIRGATKNPAVQKQAHAKWSIVCVLNNGAVEKRDGIVCLNNATTKRAILTALRDALMRFSKAAVIRIYVSDDYVRNALIQGWPKRWKANNWHRIRLNGEIKHLDLWQQISEQLSKHAVSIAGAQELENKNLKYMDWRMKNGR